MINPALADRPLSDTLEMMVHEAIISESVAVEFNQLPTEELQRKAVERYMEERQVLARMIVADVTHRTIPLAVADTAMESTAHIQNRIDQIPPLTWQELSDEFFTGLVPLRAAGPWIQRHAFWLALIFGTAWVLSPRALRNEPEIKTLESLPRVPATLSPAAPLHRPSGVARSARTLPLPAEPAAVEPFQVHPLFHGEPPPPPKDLVLELVHGHEAVLRWNSLLGIYRYNLYWASAHDPAHFQKDPASPLSRPSAIWPFPTPDHAYIIRVTSVDVDGHESVLSAPLRIDLTPSF